MFRIRGGGKVVRHIVLSILLAFMAVPFLVAGVAQASVFTPLVFDYNADISDKTLDNIVINGEYFPRGAQNFNGVPFYIPEAGQNNYWNFNEPRTYGIKSLDVDITAPGIDKVYTLINSLWGERSVGARAWIDFTGDNGATYHYDLDGNFNVRDYNQGNYTNRIDDPNTVKVWSRGTQRLDMQIIDLPDSFLTASSVTMTLTDNGNPSAQRICLYGATIETPPVPLPGAVWLLGSGLVGLVGLRRKMQR